jgi:hypothetical protein
MFGLAAGVTSEVCPFESTANHIPSMP